MKPELSVAYLHSIESDPIPRLIAMSAAAWTDDWKSRVEAALDSDLVGLPLYDAWPTSRAIPKEEWDAKLNANWARLAEYDRLTEERNLAKATP